MQVENSEIVINHMIWEMLLVIGVLYLYSQNMVQCILVCCLNNVVSC